jgi:di/tricarboxylate transporter
MPGPHAIAVIIVAIATFYLYTRPWIRIELVSLLMMLALLLLFYVFPYEGAESLTDTQVFQAFGHPALIAICCLMIVGQGLSQTGAMEPAARMLGRLWRFNRPLGFLVTLLVAGGASAFINDTPMLVMLLPLLLDLCRRMDYPRAKLLMPVNCAILAGGMLTVIGTSTNILVLFIAVSLGMKPMGILDFTSISIVAFAIAIPYLWLVAPLLLPNTGSGAAVSQRTFEARIVVREDNPKLLARRIGDLSRSLGRTLPLSKLLRNGMDHAFDDALVLLPNDTLILNDTPEGLREIASAFQADLFDRQGLDRFVAAAAARDDVQFAEVVVGAHSNLAGRTVREARFAEQHEVAVIGINRDTEGLVRGTDDVADTRLASGDIVLVQGSPERIAKLRAVPHLLLLDGTVSMPRTPQAKWALMIMAGIVVFGATRILPVHVAAFAGVIMSLYLGCVRFESMGRALSAEVVLVVASSIALGQALISTGAAAWAANGLAVVLQLLPPAGQVALVMGSSALLTNFVSNSATAAVGTPIAIATAAKLGAPMEPYVLAIMFGANLCYATPMAYQTNLMIMTVGGYRFMDYVRVGLPLVLLMLTTLSILLARHYGL